ncbi:hypothetical protein H8959_015111 [Pygathrix nigripes]
MLGWRVLSGSDQITEGHQHYSHPSVYEGSWLQDPNLYCEHSSPTVGPVELADTKSRPSVYERSGWTGDGQTRKSSRWLQPSLCPAAPWRAVPHSTGQVITGQSCLLRGAGGGVGGSVLPDVDRGRGIDKRRGEIPRSAVCALGSTLAYPSPRPVLTAQQRQQRHPRAPERCKGWAGLGGSQRDRARLAPRSSWRVRRSSSGEAPRPRLYSSPSRALALPLVILDLGAPSWDPGPVRGA